MNKQELRMFELLRSNFIKAFKQDYDVEMNLHINDEEKNEFIIDYEIGINYIVNSFQICDMIYGTTIEEFLEIEIEGNKDIMEVCILEDYDIKLHNRMVKFFSEQLELIKVARSNNSK